MSVSVKSDSGPAQVVPPPGYTILQARDVPSFVPPKLDGTLYFAEFIDWHLQWSQHHNYSILVGKDGQENIPITWGEFGRAIHRVAQRIAQAVPDGPADINGRPKTIAILSSVDSLTYYTIMLATMRAGFEPFPLSNRNSIPALKHLLSESGAQYLIGTTGGDSGPVSALEETTTVVLSELVRDGYSISLIRAPHYWDAYPRLKQFPCPLYDPKADADTTELMPPLRSLSSYKCATGDSWAGLILHSSGSTKFPKVIRTNQRMLRHWADWPWYGDWDIGGTILAAAGFPPFHAGGLTIGLGLAIACGSTLAHLLPTEPAQLWTSETAFHTIKNAQVDWFVTVPAFLDTWSHNVEIMKYLSTLKAIYSAGGPLSQEPGERLLEAGVNVMNLYGSTEIGIITKLSVNRLKDWQYMELSPLIKYRLVADDEAGLAYRLILESSDNYTPAATNVPGEDSFDTNDLVVLDPTDATIRVLGRADDQIMHSTGEKTNPGPLENIMLGSPLVRSAVYFGRARPMAGILVEPARPIPLSEDNEIAKFRNAIYPYVERANNFAPSHSRVFKEYILIADAANKPFARTAKGSIQRAVVLSHYEDEINKIYDAVDQYNEADWATPPSEWDAQSICDFVTRLVNGVMRGSGGDEVEQTRDLFEQGCDSLQGTVIRNGILNALRQRSQQMSLEKRTDFVASVPTNLVFSYPTVRSLSNFVTNLVLGSAIDLDGVLVDHPAAMRAMMQKYISDFPDHQLYGPGGALHDLVNGVSPTSPTASVPEQGECVLITGTTGTLGAYLLAALLRDPQVTMVFALNRSNKEKTLVERQAHAFTDRGLDGSLVDSSKLRLIEASIWQADLGMDPMLLHEIRATITTIIHNAWRLDFNLTLASFETHIRGSRHLVDLALTSPRAAPPQILFMSSIGAVGSWAENARVPERNIGDPEVAVGMGYGESKWIVEQILHTASEECNLSASSFRIGQLSGSTINGAWNVTDWLPHLVKSGTVMSVLPSMEDKEIITWIPVDIAAESIVEAMYNRQRRYHTLHIVHPFPISWNLAMEYIQAELEFRGHSIVPVPYKDWFSKLERWSQQAHAQDSNPAIKLIDFFRSGTREYNGIREAMGFPMMETVETGPICKSMNTAVQVNRDDVRRWMMYWDKRGLFA